MLFFQGNSESANFQCKAQTLKWQLPKECSRADLFPCRNDKFLRVFLGTCCVYGTSDDLIAVRYSQAGESSWELASEWWFPFRRNCLWGRLCKKMPLLSVRLSGNSYCGKVQDESVLHHEKTHLIPLKLLLVTIVSFIITCYFNRRDIYTSSVLLWYHSKHPRALGKPFIGFSGIKICLCLFFLGERELLTVDSFVQKYWEPWQKDRGCANVLLWKLHLLDLKVTLAETLTSYRNGYAKEVQTVCLIQVFSNTGIVSQNSWLAGNLLCSLNIGHQYFVPSVSSWYKIFSSIPICSKLLCQSLPFLIALNISFSNVFCP